MSTWSYSDYGDIRWYLVDCFGLFSLKMLIILDKHPFPPLLSCPMVSHGGQNRGRLVSGSTVGPVFVHFVGIEVAFYSHSRHNVIKKMCSGVKNIHIYIYSIVLMYIPFWCYLQFIIWSSNKKRFSHCRDRTWRCFSSLNRAAFGSPGEPVSIWLCEFLSSAEANDGGTRDGFGECSVTTSCLLQCDLTLCKLHLHPSTTWNILWSTLHSIYIQKYIHDWVELFFSRSV